MEKLVLKRRSSTLLSPAEIEFSNHVIAGMSVFARKIDVTRFVNEQQWDCDKILDLFIDVLWNTPEVFYVAKTCKYEERRQSDGVVVEALITGIKYGIRKIDFARCQIALNRAIEKAMECIQGVTAPEEKALRLHDYLVRICEYDTEAANKGDTTLYARTAFSVLVRHRAVCEGYTMAYRLLLNQAGIDSEEVVSEEMNHCWNYVRIGDNWYHVDVTFDDPVYHGQKPTEDKVIHENFLLSDDKIRRTPTENPHQGWDTRNLPPANDSRFDNRIWN